MTYAPPRYKRSKVPPHHTVIKVFHGKGAAFEGKTGVRFDDFPDGTSNTLLIVEAGEPVPWTAPQELEYNPDGPMPRLDCSFESGFRAAFGDGSVRWVRRDTDDAALRAAITRNGGEVIPLE